MASSRIASRYSKSLIALATESGVLDDVKSDMDSIAAICADSRELVSLLKNPIVTSDDKKAILGKVFKDANATTQNFIAFLVDKKREAELPMVAQQFIAEYDEMKGIAKATVISAVELSKETLDKVRSYITGILGKEGIELTNTIDPSIIGGLIIKHDDKLIDMSVSKELREIRKTLIHN